MYSPLQICVCVCMHYIYIYIYIYILQALDTGGTLESPEKAMEETSLGDENGGVEKDGGGVLSLDGEQ